MIYLICWKFLLNYLQNFYNGVQKSNQCADEKKKSTNSFLIITSESFYPFLKTYFERDMGEKEEGQNAYNLKRVAGETTFHFIFLTDFPNEYCRLMQI